MSALEITIFVMNLLNILNPVVTPSSVTADENYKIIVDDRVSVLSHQIAPLVDTNRNKSVAKSGSAII